MNVPSGGVDGEFRRWFGDAGCQKTTTRIITGTALEIHPLRAQLGSAELHHLASTYIIPQPGQLVTICLFQGVEGGVMYILLNGIQILIFDNQYLPLLMLDWEFSSEKSLPFSAPTDASSLCAPLQHPLDNEELPPELTLDGSGWYAKEGRPCAPAATRKRSIDQPYSILGFIERRISDRRGRVNSQELNKPRTHCY